MDGIALASPLPGRDGTAPAPLRRGRRRRRRR